MQPTEGYSVARRPLDIEDYIDLLRRHKSWVFGPFLLTLVISVVGVYTLWPDSYESQAVVMVKPQQIPENMVQSSISQDLTDRIQSMQTQIRSRNILTEIIIKYDLYKRDRQRLPMVDVADNMNKKILIQPTQTTVQSRNIPAFVIQFSYENRLMAQAVVQELVSRFIERNVSDRTGIATSSTKFLQNESDRAKKVLEDVENQLTEFRMKNNGRLPDQTEANMRQLQSLQANATFLDNAMSRSESEKLQMQTNVQIFEDNIKALGREQVVQAAERPKSERLLDAERQVQSLELALTSLRQHYTESYPDVQVTKGLLETAKQTRDQLAKEEADAKKQSSSPSAPALNTQTQREIRDLEANVTRLKSQIEAKNLEIADYNKQRKKTQDSINTYQALIEALPVGDRQYGDLIRERDLAKDKYTNLDLQLSKAQVSEEMENSAQGELLEILDPASLPSPTPTDPKRPFIIAIGAGFGLLFGVVIAGVREVKDTSLKNLKDVRAYTQMAILGSVPLLENDFVLRRRKRLAWLGWTTACLVAAVTMAGSMVYYYYTKS